MSKVYNTYNISLFGEPPQKNRRLNPKEQAEEKEDAAIWRRPQRTFLLDKPYYPWCPKDPEKFISDYYRVNFDLNFIE